MKFNKAYLIAMAALGMALASCTHDEPDFFSVSDNSVYFSATDETGTASNLNFATHIVHPIDSINIELDVKLLGHLADYERRVLLVGEPIEGYEEAIIDSLPKVVTFAPGEYQKRVELCVRRPLDEDSTYALSLRLQPISDDIGEGGAEGVDADGNVAYNAHDVYVSCIYSEPASWKENEVYNFFGEWTKDKHIFLARSIYGNDNYTDYTALELGGGYDSVLDFLRVHRDSLSYDVPYYFCEDITMFKFSQPDYWTELHDLYLDNFTTRPYHAGYTFLQIAQAEGLTTKTDKAYFEGDEARMQQLNSRAVEIMQDVYDKLYMTENFTTTNYATRFYVPFVEGIDYNLREPYCWSAYAPEGKALLDSYYGTYSKEKFTFMIKTLLEADSPFATLYYLFPISRTWDSKTESYKVNFDRHYKDDTYTSYYTGEEILTTLNALFREADTENIYNFPIITE